MLNTAFEMQHDSKAPPCVAQEVILHDGASVLENREHFESLMDHIWSIGIETTGLVLLKRWYGRQLVHTELNSTSIAPSVEAVQATKCAIINV